MPAAIVAEHLNIAHTLVDTVKTMKDKSVMRSLSNQLTRTPIAYKKVKESKELFSFAEKNGFPFILKPKEGVGSIGVKK